VVLTPGMICPAERIGVEVAGGVWAGGWSFPASVLAHTNAMQRGTEAIKMSWGNFHAPPGRQKSQPGEGAAMVSS
jgi:hypothetical protein